MVALVDKPLGRSSAISRVKQTEIEEAVIELLDTYGFMEYPVSIAVVAETLGIELVPYSMLDSQHLALAKLASDDAFGISTRDYAIVKMVVNDTEGSRVVRSRFSGAHEIGHIWLDHDENQSGKEAEADYFAGYLLAPHPLVMRCRNALEVQERFGISAPCAEFAWDQAHDRVDEGPWWRPHELWLLNNIEWRGGGLIGRP